MEEYLKKVKETNSYLLNTWIPGGQNQEDKELEALVVEIMGDPKFAIGQECEFRLHCTGSSQEFLYNVEKFEALDAVSKELAYNLNLLGYYTGNPYNAESVQVKFFNDLKAKYGYNKS